MLMEALVQQQYDRLAAIYDQRWRFYISNTLTFLVDWAKIAPAEQVLDVACGTGELEWLLAKQYPHQRIVGVDFSAQMLAIARQKCRDLTHVQFQQSQATTLSQLQTPFDVVVCANAFHYFSEPETVLAEMAQVLADSGRVIILDWCRDFLVCRLCDWVLGWLDPAHQQCYSQAELHSLLRGAGYQVERSQRVRFGWIWGLMIVEVTLNAPEPVDSL